MTDRWLTRDEFLAYLVEGRLYNASVGVVEPDGSIRGLNFTKPTDWWRGFLSDPRDIVRADFQDWGPV